MLLKKQKKYLENLAYHERGHSVIKFALRGEVGLSKCKRIYAGGGWSRHCECLDINFFN